MAQAARPQRQDRKQVPGKQQTQFARLYQAQQLPEALALARELVDSYPTARFAWKALGTVLLENGHPEEAESALQKALELNPKDAELHNTMGKTLHQLGRPEETLQHLEQALTLDPDFEQAQNWITKFLVNAGRYEEALARLDKALRRHPKSPVLLTRKAHALQQLGRFSEGLAVYEQLVELYPDDPARLSNLGNSYRSVGRFDEAEAAYLKAIELQPDNFLYYSNYLQSLHYNPAHDTETLYQAHLDWDRRYSPSGVSRAEATDREPGRRLRIGMISAGFRAHPVGQMITSALEHLPTAAFELYAYTMHDQVDVLTQRMQRRCDHWQSVTHLSDAALADQIRHDCIDILLDLCGHTEGNRSLTLAMEPAPIQVKWVGGQINTSGLSAMDYMISDRIETPPGCDSLYTEKLIRLPDDYVCYMPRGDAPDVGVLPALSNGYVTFGCFNNPSKLNPVIIEHWATILSAVPNSHLFLKGSQYNTAEFIERISQQFESHGIDQARLIFEGHSAHLALLDCYNRVDIALDPWPYSGGLTTCEALLMGVPVITLPGPSFAGRHSATHLTNAGLPELVADDWTQYESLAVSLAGDLDNLSTIRRGLRKQLKESPVCNYRRFASHLTTALRAVWQRYCDGRAPAALTFDQRGEARFDDAAEAVRIVITTSEKPHESVRAGEHFNWSLPRRVIVIDNGCKLLSEDDFERLHRHETFAVIGFDPGSRLQNRDELTADDNIQLFPHATLGDGREATLHACLDESLSGLLKPLSTNQAGPGARVLTTLPINTLALDAIQGLEGVDWLILDGPCDVLTILEKGKETLRDTLLLQVRILFQPRFENQPDIGALLHWATANGFSFYRMNNPDFIHPVSDITPGLAATQLESADLLFVPDPGRMARLTEGQRRILAFLMHSVFGITDLSQYLLRGIAPALAETYGQAVSATSVPVTSTPPVARNPTPAVADMGIQTDSVSNLIDQLLQ